MEKIWKSVNLSLDSDQDVLLHPSEGWSGIELSFKEVEDKEFGRSLYLDRKSMVALIEEMRSLMNYTVGEPMVINLQNG